MGLRVLLVEDNEMLQRAYARALRGRGHTVTIAASVQEGRTALADGPDVLLLDREVPDGDGWSLRHETPPGCRVVLMSGNAPPGSPPYWSKSGVDELYALIEGDA